jgi:hypothetical protein
MHWHPVAQITLGRKREARAVEAVIRTCDGNRLEGEHRPISIMTINITEDQAAGEGCGGLDEGDESESRQRGSLASSACACPRF